jgi:hypothetical protein
LTGYQSTRSKGLHLRLRSSLAWEWLISFYDKSAKRIVFQRGAPVAMLATAAGSLGKTFQFLFGPFALARLFKINFNGLPVGVMANR